jgi:dihydroxy-acid dehydratase
VGGPLALVRDGDLITLDVEARRIDMQVDEKELARRRAAWQQPEPKFTRGYGVLYLKHIRQADTGCDFDFLEAERAADAPGGEPEIH